MEEDNNEMEESEIDMGYFLDLFAKPDFIMEPNVYEELRKYFQSGGNAEVLVDKLSENYQALSQSINVMSDLLEVLEIKQEDIDAHIEQHILEVVYDLFDPARADSIFHDAQGVPSWLAKSIEFPCWRRLYVKLAERYNECLMLRFVVKLISDSGYQDEITSVATACQQLPVFSKLLSLLVERYLKVESEPMFRKQLGQLLELLLHSEQGYVYGLSYIYGLASKGDVGSPLWNSLIRLTQEAEAAALRRGFQGAFDVTFSLMNIACRVNTESAQRAVAAIKAMLKKNSLNPADMNQLYRLYSAGSDVPSLELIRHPLFLDMLVKAVYRPALRINPDYRQQYLFLLSFASCVSLQNPDEYSLASSRGQHSNRFNKDELRASQQAVETSLQILGLSDGRTLSSAGDRLLQTDFLHDLPTLLNYMKWPVVSSGLICYLEDVLLTADVQVLLGFSTVGAVGGATSAVRQKVHLVLLDEIATLHPLLHEKCLSLLRRLFEAPMADLDDLSRLEVRKAWLDRMLHILSRGTVQPVLDYIVQCWQRSEIDNSLFRHFLIELLDVISEPYGDEFLRSLKPLLLSQEVTVGVREIGGADISLALDNLLEALAQV